MILHEKTIGYLQNASFFKKWILVLGTFIFAMAFCYWTALHDGNMGSALLLFIVPIAFSTIYFNTPFTISLSVGGAIVGLFDLML